MRQSSLFDKNTAQGEIDARQVVLYALGDFQSRGKVLAERDLPLDRLRGALKRASEAFGVEELEDELAVAALSALGASVRRVPPFVAKHPFRVIVPTELAERAGRAYREIVAKVKQPNASAAES
ncbi:MAG TPA: hypothetical protein VD966_03240, partial [Pyrinomonadaceae bacterium]|nr:hypothetical protein [Pyrinomonadaceae bacterium]